MMKTNKLIQSALMLFLLVIGSQAFAQEKDKSNIFDQDKESSNLLQAIAVTDTKCFTSGSGSTFMKVCISNRGNILNFEAPAGVTHITSREGYVVCSNNFAAPKTHGYDAGVAEEGWGVPTIEQPNGEGQLPLVITRNSIDGILRLKQTFNFTAAAREITVKVEVKNLSVTTLPGVVLSRYFDGDIDGSSSDIYDRTIDSVWGKDPTNGVVKPGRGLMLTLAPTSLNQPFVTIVETFADWNPLSTAVFGSARGCLGFSKTAPTAPGDFVGRLTMRLDIIDPGRTKSVTFRYRQF
jgi:hypothetical protein